MTDEADVTLALLNGKSTVRVFAGTFVSATAAALTVDIPGGGRIVAAVGAGYLPEVNEPVWVWFIDGKPYVMGPTTVKPGKGTVISASGGFATLSTSIGNVVVPYDSRLSPTAGQVMKLTWQEGGFGIAVYSAVPAAPVAPVAPSTGATQHVDTFTAGDAGSYQSGRWWTPEVWASDNNLGAWFYGSKIADTIPAGAVVTRVELYISAKQIQGYAPNIGMHALGSKVGAPSFTGTQAIAVAPGWVDLPASWGNSLKSGGGQLGVGVNHGGYNIFRSLAQDGSSGALRITSTY